MPYRQIDLDKVLALEANLRLAQSDIIALREQIRQMPNYQGDWMDHPSWRAARRSHRRYVTLADEVLKKRHNKEVIS